MYFKQTLFDKKDSKNLMLVKMRTLYMFGRTKCFQVFMKFVSYNVKTLVMSEFNERLNKKNDVIFRRNKYLQKNVKILSSRLTAYYFIDYYYNLKLRLNIYEINKK